MFPSAFGTGARAANDLRERRSRGCGLPLDGDLDSVRAAVGINLPESDNFLR